MCDTYTESAVPAVTPESQRGNTSVLAAVSQSGSLRLLVRKLATDFSVLTNLPVLSP